MVQASDFKPAWASVDTDLPNNNTNPSHIIPGDDDDVEINDLQFSTSIDTSVTQNVQMKSTYDNPTTAINNNENDTTEQEYGISSQPPTAAQGDQSSVGVTPPHMLSDSSHPFACIFHCLFKFCAFALYLFGGVFTRGKHGGSHFIIITVCCILLLSVDFWVVKNITGRLLVGLRWWNMVSDDGQSTRWIFESSENPNVNKFDNAVFWSVLYATPVFWSTFLFIGFLKFEVGWLIIVLMGLTLSYANVYGYYKCSSDQKAKFQNLMVRGAELGMMAAVKNNVFGMLSRVAARGTGGSMEMSGRGSGGGGAASQFTI